MNNLTYTNILGLLSKQNNSLDIMADNSSIYYKSILDANQTFQIQPIIPISYINNKE